MIVDFPMLNFIFDTTSVAEQGRSVLIVTCHNSATDSAIENLKNQSIWLSVRIHWAWRKEDCYNLVTKPKSHLVGFPDHTQQQEPSLISSNDLTTKATTEDLMMHVTVDFMQCCKQVYSAKATVLHPVDPCMQKLDFAIHIWMLKIAGIIPGKWSSRPMDDQIKAGAHDE